MGKRDQIEKRLSEFPERMTPDPGLADAPKLLAAERNKPCKRRNRLRLVGLALPCVMLACIAIPLAVYLLPSQAPEIPPVIEEPPGEEDGQHYLDSPTNFIPVDDAAAFLEECDKTNYRYLSSGVPEYLYSQVSSQAYYTAEGEFAYFYQSGSYLTETNLYNVRLMVADENVWTDDFDAFEDLPEQTNVQGIEIAYSTYTQSDMQSLYCTMKEDGAAYYLEVEFLGGADEALSRFAALLFGDEA